jgi:hypothetical protein
MGELSQSSRCLIEGNQQELPGFLPVWMDGPELPPQAQPSTSRLANDGGPAPSVGSGVRSAVVLVRCGHPPEVGGGGPKGSQRPRTTGTLAADRGVSQGSAPRRRGVSAGGLGASRAPVGGDGPRGVAHEAGRASRDEPATTAPPPPWLRRV